MMEINRQTTVAEVAVQHPEAKAALERMGLDYCCGGAEPLEHAARERGLTLADVQREIEAAIAAHRAWSGGGSRDWSTAGVGELARHILDTHHVFMKAQLPRLSDLFDKVLRAHGENHGAMLLAVREQFQALREEIEMHLMKEERILFPYIMELARYAAQGGPAPESHCGTVQNPIRQMMHEHENAGEALARMRERTSDYTPPADACPTFEALFDGLQQMEADLHEHIHLENNILFPKAIEIEQGVRA